MTTSFWPWRTLAIRVCLLGLVVAIHLAGCGTSPTPAATGSGGLLYSDGTRLWRIEPNRPTAAPREVVYAGERGRVGEPAWSPDGARVAYSFTPAPRPGSSFGSDIYIVEAVGGEPRALFTHDGDSGFAGAPAWSPDGAFLYFTYASTVTRPGQTAGERLQRLLRLSLGTGELAVIADNAHLPALSPDGSRLAFLRYPTNIMDAPTLWIARADGAEARQLVAAGQFKAIGAPRFSPDGTRIAFAGHKGDRSRPRLQVDRSGTPAAWWAPPVAAHGYPMDPWLVEVATGQVELLAALGADDLHVAWAPDGTHLACLASDGLFILNLSTAAFTRLSLVGDALGVIDWIGPRLSAP
jgi:Tol biopolymer transport system component